MIEEFEAILREATKTVEDSIAQEDKGWINLSTISAIGELTTIQRKEDIKRSRYYALTDPLAAQALRLWTDYTFGTGMSYHANDKTTTKVLDGFWKSKDNKPILSPTGQRKYSHKLLTDGQIYYVLFLGSKGQATIRVIDCLEITETIANPDDIEDVRYFKREWTTPQGSPQKAYYRSFRNIKDKGTPDHSGENITKTNDALVYRLEYNNGLPLLLPALDWIKLYRQFLASRVAIMLALARFAWKSKVKGGAAAVESIKAKTNEQEIAAASHLVENLGVDTTPIKTDTGARNAYDDGRMIKLQVASATGWPEQYFGDISIGNLATAKTVELPVQKMCQSYQAIWAGAYDDIDQMVLEHNGIPEDKRYIDRDFPAITPEDAGEIAKGIAAIIPQFPRLADSRDVLQQALMAIGVQDVNAALEQLDKDQKESGGDANVALIRALQDLREVIRNNGKVSRL